MGEFTMKSVSRSIAKLVVISLFITGTLALSGISASGDDTVKFTDVPPTAWFIEDLQYILKDPRQILSGYPDGTFRPNDTLTVDMFIKIIVTAMGHEVENGKDYWASTYIEKAIEEGYIDPDNEMWIVNIYQEDPYEGCRKPIKRDYMAQVTGRALDKITDENEYRDLVAVSDLIKDYIVIPVSCSMNVVKCYDLGIITGFPDGEFKPHNILTRAEAVAVIRRLIDPSARKKVALPVVPNPSPTPVPVRELNRPVKKDLGQGVVEVEGIKFNPQTDVVDNYGAMHILKAEEYVGVFLEYLRFYEHDGKARVKGYIPELPEGYKWSIALHYVTKEQDDRGGWGGAYVTDSGFAPEQTLPKIGSTFDKTLYTNKENLFALVFICDILSPESSRGGYFWISFTEGKYSVDDRYGGFDKGQPFDTRGFFEW
jgi:hypothetical protein